MIKILIAEGNIEALRALRECMQLAGYQVLEASGGEEALRLWQEEKPDVLLLDTALPKVSGLEVLKAVRRENDQTPVLMLSSIKSEEQELEAFDEKADDYLTKPFSVRILIKRIQSLLRRSHPEADLLTIGSLQISHPAYQAWWQQEPIELTSTEFELLWIFIQKRGQVLTRSQLLDEIWGYDYAGNDRVVDAHIKNLRHKLPVNLVRTVKGRGYTLNEEACSAAEPQNSPGEN